MAQEHFLAADSWVPVIGAPKHVRDLCPGDNVMIVKADGTTAASRVVAADVVDTAGHCISLLTQVGEVLLTTDARVVTKQGLQRANDVVANVGKGVTPRLEVIHPIDMRLRSGKARKAAYREAVAVLPRPRAIIPAWLDRDLRICDQIESMLRQADLEFERHSFHDWSVLEFEQPSAAGTGAWTAPADQAAALTLLMAWSVDDNVAVARFVDGTVACLQRLCGCLAAIGAAFDVKWLPGYHPVEARVHQARVPPLRSHVPVIRTVNRMQTIHRLELEHPGAVIVGMALVR